MHPGNASRSLRRSPSSLPSLPGFVAPCATPFLIWLEHKTFLLRIRQGRLCASGGQAWVGCSLPRIQALSHVDAGRWALCAMAARW